jgi:hypothetical protein
MIGVHDRYIRWRANRQHVSLLLTDLGVLTPSAVSDELIKLYY